MAFEAFRQRLGSIIGGFDGAQAHRRLRGFRASRAHVNTLIAASGDTMLDLVGQIAAQNGATVLMVTHDPADARHLCDMVLVVAEGRASPPAPTRALLSDPPPALAAYLGSPRA